MGLEPHRSSFIHQNPGRFTVELHIYHEGYASDPVRCFFTEPTLPISLPGGSTI